MNNGKAPGIDSLQAELLKANIFTSSENDKLFLMTGVKELYSSSQRKATLATVTMSGELPYFLYYCSKISFAGCYLIALKRLLIQLSEKTQTGFRGRGC